MFVEFPVIAFLAAVLVLIPLPGHWRARNVATLSIIGWLFVMNVIYGVDAIVWGDNVDIVISVWCDITTKLIIGANFALPAACLCVCIHLESVSSIRQARTSAADKRRRQIFEALMCFGLPLLLMGLHYIVQGHRFDIAQGYGCRPTTYFSIPSIFIVWLPPLVLAICSLVFSAFAFSHFFHRRLTFARHLDNSRSGLTPSRYIRLMLMAVVEMGWTLAITLYTVYFSSLAGLRPWTSWAFVHSDWTRIDQYTPVEIPDGYYALWWTVPASTFIFVVFFVFGQDAVADYVKGINWVRRKVFRQTLTQTKLGSLGSVPASKSASSALAAITPTTPSPPKLPVLNISSTHSLPSPATSSFYSPEKPRDSFYSQPSPRSPLPPSPTTATSAVYHSGDAIAIGSVRDLEAASSEVTSVPYAPSEVGSLHYAPRESVVPAEAGHERSDVDEYYHTASNDEKHLEDDPANRV